MATRNTDIELVKQDMIYLKKGIDDIKCELKLIKGEKVSKDEFEPVKKLVYGFTSLILVAVVTALIALVINK